MTKIQPETWNGKKAEAAAAPLRKSRPIVPMQTQRHPVALHQLKYHPEVNITVEKTADSKKIRN